MGIMKSKAASAVKKVASKIGVGKKKGVVSINEETGNPQRTYTRKNIVGRPVVVTKSTDEYGRKTKDKVTKNPYTGKVRVKSKTKGVKPTITKYREEPTKSRRPARGEFNNQPMM